MKKKRRSRPIKRKADKARTILRTFIRDIESSGGVVHDPGGWYALVADPDWIDLGETYVKACGALGRKPKIATNNPAEEEDDEEY